METEGILKDAATSSVDQAPKQREYSATLGLSEVSRNFSVAIPENLTNELLVR